MLCVKCSHYHGSLWIGFNEKGFTFPKDCKGTTEMTAILGSFDFYGISMHQNVLFDDEFRSETRNIVFFHD